MAKKRVKVWYDFEGDYMEVMFEKKPGYFRQTNNDRVMEKVDSNGSLIGFSILKFSESRKKPLEAALALGAWSK